MSENATEYVVGAGVSDAVRRQLILNKIPVWQNTAVDAQIDVALAVAIENEGLKKVATQRLKNALRAEAFLTKMLAEIPDPE